MIRFRSLIAIAALSLASSATAATTGFGNTWANGIINNYLRSTAYSAFTNVYVGLGTGTAPTTNAGAQTALGSQEVTPSSTGYQRVAVASGTGAWASPTTGNSSNSAAITFPSPTGNWCSGTTYCTWYFVADVQCTSSSVCGNGNVLLWGTLTNQKNVNTGDAAPSFAIGALTIQLTLLDPGYFLHGALAANEPMVLVGLGG